MEEKAQTVTEKTPELTESLQSQAEEHAGKVADKARPMADQASETIEGGARHVAKGEHLCSLAILLNGLSESRCEHLSNVQFSTRASVGCVECLGNLLGQRAQCMGPDAELRYSAFRVLVLCRLAALHRSDHEGRPCTHTLPSKCRRSPWRLTETHSVFWDNILTDRNLNDMQRRPSMQRRCPTT